MQCSKYFDAICFLYADFLWAKGGIEFALRKIAAGYEGVLSPVPPVITEEFYKSMSSKYKDFVFSDENNDCEFNISIEARELVRFAKPILHPMMRDNNFDNIVSTTNTAYVLWSGPNDDLLIRCFHIHPVMLKVKHDTPAYWVPFHMTLDEWFLPQAFPSTDKLYFVADSDEIAIISLYEEDFLIGYTDEPMNAVSIANKLNRMQHPCIRWPSIIIQSGTNTK